MIVKVCGVRTPEIAEVAIDAGADWLGLVLVPASPRHADDREARTVVNAVRGRADLVGVMVDASAADCEAAAQRYRLAAVQVHGRVAPAVAASAGVTVIRAINVTASDAVLTEQWWADGLLLLDGPPASEAALPGGTGTRVDETVAAALARHRRVILAGGLSADNIATAVAAVRPYGVDASSGLEFIPGVKDAARVHAYVAAARAAASASAPAAPQRR